MFSSAICGVRAARQRGLACPTISILATVRTSLGSPLPGQDVRFTTTSGTLDPQAGTPVRSDDFGNATTILTLARQQTTIAAQSGKATQSLSINTATCNISTIALDLNSVTFNDCADKIVLTATVEDTSSNPCVGISVQFVTVPSTPPSGDIQLFFRPGSSSTNASGQVTTTITLNPTDCTSKCVNKDCNTSQQQVKALAGSVSSAPIPFQENM